MNILGISGSLRAKSFNSALLRVAASVAPEGINVEIADIRDIPLYDDDVYAEGFPEAVETLRAQVRAADGLLIATPEYNYSIPGVLKNAIDWVSRPPEQPFDGKPVALIGAAAGAMGTARSQYHLRQVFVFLNGHVLNKPELMIPAAHNAFDENGELPDEGLRDRVAATLVALSDWAKVLS